MRTGTVVSYRVFVRNWWRRERRNYPMGKLMPDPSARKTTTFSETQGGEA